MLLFSQRGLIDKVTPGCAGSGRGLKERINSVAQLKQFSLLIREPSVKTAVD